MKLELSTRDCACKEQSQHVKVCCKCTKKNTSTLERMQQIFVCIPQFFNTAQHSTRHARVWVCAHCIIHHSLGSKPSSCGWGPCASRMAGSVLVWQRSGVFFPGMYGALRVNGLDVLS